MTNLRLQSRILLAVLATMLLAPLGIAFAAVNNPLANAVPLTQGPDPTGNAGYPFAVVQATGSTWSATISGNNTPADAFANPSNASPTQAFPEVYNGATWDLLRSANTANAAAGTGLLGVGNLGWDSGNSLWRRLLANSSGILITTSSATGTPADAFAAPGAVTQEQAFPMIFNGTTWDQWRSSASASGGAGTGVPSTGPEIFDVATSNYFRWKSFGVGSGTIANTGAPMVQMAVYAGSGNAQLVGNAQNTPDAGLGGNVLAGGMYALNASTQFDRVRTAEGAQNTTGTGLLGAGMEGYDGTNWQRVKVGTAGTSLGTLQVSQNYGTFSTDGQSRNIATYVDTAGNANLGEAVPMLFNGTNYDRTRTGNSLDAGLSTGVQAVHDTLTDDNNGTFASVTAKADYRYRVVSATNTQQQVVADLRNLHDTIAINMSASGGTATVTVEASADNANWMTIDSIAAASATAKQYTATTVGGTTALSPLSFRWCRITAGAAGVGNTTTLTIGAK